MKKQRRMPHYRIIRSLRGKIVIVFCFCVIIPLLCINIVTMKQYQQSLEKNTLDVYGMLSDQIETNLDTYLSSVKRISLYPYYNHEVQDILYDISIRGESVQMTKEVNDIMSDLLFDMLIQDQNIQSIFLTDLDGQVLYHKSNGGYYRSTDFFKSYVRDMDGEFTVIPTHSQSYVSRARKSVFSYVRVVKEVNTNTPIGYAILEIDSHVIQNMVERISDGTDEYIMITQKSGGLLNSNIPEELLPAFQEYVQNGAGQTQDRADINGRRYLISISSESSNDLVTWICQNEEKTMKELNQMARANLLLILLIGIGALAVTLLVSGKLTDPLVRLRDAMIQVKKGDFSARVKTDGGSDEVSELAECYNSMLGYIDDLITKEYKLQIQERDANLRALQNQINPHFLYNALESIAMTAEINEDEDVAEMVADLGDFMRFSLTAGDAMVPLGEELTCVENYVRIQNVRFENQIGLSVVCPDELREYRIVKMSVQPVVENAILHGMEPARKIHIVIRACREASGNLQIMVRDDGKGMNPETLSQIGRNLEQKEELYLPRHGIGLRNVHQRIRLRYGGGYGLSFESIQGKGTTVMLRLPGERGGRGCSGS